MMNVTIELTFGQLIVVMSIGYIIRVAVEELIGMAHRR